MKQIPYLCNNNEEFERHLLDFKQRLESCGTAASSVLVTLYVSIVKKNDINWLISRVKEEMPDAKIIGGTVAANITGGNIDMDGLSMTFTIFEFSKVDVKVIDWDDSKAREIGKNYLYYLRNLSQPVAVQLLSSGFNLNVVPFFKEVSNCPDDILFFGGVVDDGTMGGNGCVFTGDKICERGMISVAFMGNKLQVLQINSCGWKPLGKFMTITKVEGDNIIKEIDHVPVRDIYEKYLGTVWDDSFLERTIVFPFSFERYGAIMNRLPRAIYNDGSVGYGADIQLGESVRLTYGDPAAVISDARAIQYDMNRFQPDGIFAVSCWARKVLLNKDINQELEVCRRCAPSNGIYAFGEYIRSDGRLIVANMNLSIVGFREGNSQACCSNSYVAEPLKMEYTNTTMSQLIKLIEVVSSELQVANEQLIKMAHIDKLTDLLNRGELDNRAGESFQMSNITGKPMTVLMLDIDNFKHVNDTYGHDAGDQALKAMALVLKDSTRGNDFAGRWGGDEFIVVLNGANLHNAESVAERIRKRVAKAEIGNDHFHISSSIGVAQLRKNETKEELFKRVDAALYNAKYTLGKNAVYVDRDNG